jgi:hypothetical protein
VPDTQDDSDSRIDNRAVARRAKVKQCYEVEPRSTLPSHEHKGLITHGEAMLFALDGTTRGFCMTLMTMDNGLGLERRAASATARLLSG